MKRMPPLSLDKFLTEAKKLAAKHECSLHDVIEAKKVLEMERANDRKLRGSTSCQQQ
jgi:hypothetical protein